MAISLLIGLGNPGPEYSKTRHNAGFWFIDVLAEMWRARMLSESKLHADLAKVDIAGARVLLAKPSTWMNRSGLAVNSICQYYKIAPEDVLIAHDELDLPPGAARLKFDGGHGGQNGLRDIIAQFGHARFHRLRLGIGHPGHKDQVTPWVLGRASAEHERAIQDAIAEAAAVMPMLIADRFNEAQKQLHTAKS
jgi:PTH1 family peptidyl-tRNA hydrolase